MKLKETVSWLMGTLQGSLFPAFEECFSTRLTYQEKQLIKILDISKVEKYVPRKAGDQWLGRKRKEREAISRAFVAKHVPLIDKNGRGGEVIPMDPHEAARYRERSSAERLNSRVKEDFGARNVMVRGAKK